MEHLELKKIFEKAYDDWSEKIFSFTFYKVSNKDKALDITQDTYMKTWDYLKKGNEVKNIKAFLYRTANNLIIDEYRRRDRRKTSSLDNLIEDGLQISDGGDEIIRNKSEVKNVIEVLEQLPEIYREALTFRLVQEMPVKEIGEIIGEEPATVSVRIHRGIKMLKNIILKNDNIG